MFCMKGLKSKVRSQFRFILTAKIFISRPCRGLSKGVVSPVNTVWGHRVRSCIHTFPFPSALFRIKAYGLRSMHLGAFIFAVLVPPFGHKKIVLSCNMKIQAKFTPRKGRPLLS